jgi:hypothetical protein
MWSRVTGRGNAKTLPADLKRVTHSGVLDIPKELLTPVVEASKNEEDRPEIMKHIRECLAEPSGKQWRRIYGGLVLVDALVKDGSPALITETAEGRHFDLVQRLSFLEHFDNTDKRVMNNIRKKSEEIRKAVVPLIEDAALKDTENCDKDTDSTCSPGAASESTGSQESISISASASSSSAQCFGPDNLPPVASSEPSKRMILNNIVTVGHNDDTTSESEGDNDNRPPVQYREPRRMTAKERNSRRSGSSSDSDDAPNDSQLPSKPIANSMDLLGL